MYTAADLVRIAKRENNNKRSYLVVDPLQGKHIPVSPTKVLKLLDELADVVKEQYKNERLLLVGFAETATAIGAAAAVRLGTDYIQTTREVIPDVEYMFFSEEHSHATEQKLIKNDIDQAAEYVSRIVFVEDEVTTGKTILNIISIMEKEYPEKFQFSVLSLLNGMTEEHFAQYAKRGINLHYLVKTDHSTFGEIAETFAGDGNYVETVSAINSNQSDSNNKSDIDGDINIDVEIGADESYHLMEANGYLNARRLVHAEEYKRACDSLWNQIKDRLAFDGKLPKISRVLVLGTEEFMYPAIYVGKQLEALGNVVYTHSTTRSPIAVSTEDNYPVHNRYELRSLYDIERRTFIYDIDTYDYVVIVTDSTSEKLAGINSLIAALKMKNDDITVVRWC